MNLETRTQLETAAATHWKDKIFLQPGKSFKQWFNEPLSTVTRFLRDKIWQAIFGKNVSALSILLDGAEKKAVFESIDQLAERPVG
jgi:hypothetical protein